MDRRGYLRKYDFLRGWEREKELGGAESH